MARNTNPDTNNTATDVTALIAKTTFPALIGIVALWLLLQDIQTYDFSTIIQNTRDIPALGWATAALATLTSFWAIGRYDSIIHRHIQSPIPSKRARRAGVVSIALSQQLGFGLLTGTLARWRMLPDLSFWQAAQITGGVSISFMANWGVLVLISGLFGTFGLILGGVIALTVLALCVLTPRLRLGRLSLHLPTLPALAALFTLTAVDCLFAGLTLYALLPPGHGLALSQIVPATMLALGLGLISGTPGGLGAFELTLLALTPPISQPAVLTAILGFRLIYFALPACLALIGLAAPPRPKTVAPPPQTPLSRYTPKRAESGVLRQSNATILTTPRAAVGLLETGQTLTALFDPLQGGWRDLAQDFERKSRHINKLAVVYKASARHAACLRSMGWPTARIAQEAVIDPARFSSQGPETRQLRRKLKKAAQAGITTRRLTVLPFAQLAALDRAWCAAKGPARGFSMGLYCPNYIRYQTVFAAYQNDRMIAFVTFHQTPSELCLDLMRHGHDCPDGTMHSLILSAINHAKSIGCTRLSLAALPAPPPSAWPWRALHRGLCSRSGQTGLIQFKSGFAPRLEPLYIAAPTRVALILGGLDILQTIRRPAKSIAPNPLHHLHEDYEFASPPQT